MRLRLRVILPVTVAVALTWPVAAQQNRSPYTVAETGRGYASLDDAVDAIGDGTGTILIASGIHRDCTVQTAGQVTYRAVEPGKAIFEGTACEEKATLVLRGRGSAVDGLVFRGIRVPDGNGAGIRTEIGDLVVTNSMFLDSQQGILGGHPSGQRISIDRSTFAGLGQCDETVDCSHSIYLANQGSVSITRSRFERGTGGHYVKLRTPRATITDSSFDDSAGAKTNYMIDLPNGATGEIARNQFVQGRNKENWSAFIVVAAEARDYRSTGLAIAGNDARLAPGVERSPAFVADLSGDRLALGENRLGTGIRAFERR